MMRRDTLTQDAETVAGRYGATGDASPAAAGERAAREGDASGVRGAEDSAPRESERAGEDARLWTREEAWLLAGCALLAFLLRFLLAWGVEHVITPDGVGYAALGRELAAGNLAGVLSTYWPPLYPLLVGLAALVFDDVESAGRFVSVVAGGLTVLPVYALARVSYGPRVARLAAVITALHPLLIYYSTLVLTEATYTLLFTCGVLAGWLALRGGRARAFLSTGAFFGACYLLKPEAAGYALLLVVMALGANLFGRRLPWGKRFGNVFALCVGFLLLALPYIVYLRGAAGRWTLSAKFGGHLWQGSRRAGDVAPPAGSLLPDATTAVVQLTKALRHEYEVFNLIVPPVFVLLVGVALLGRGWTRERARRELYLALVVAATLAGYAVTLPNIRFIVPLVPLVMCWAAKGVVELGGWAARTAGGLGAGARVASLCGRLAVPLAVVVLVASLAPLFVYLMRGDKWSDYRGQKRAAAWIRGHSARGAPSVMATVPLAAFYAGGRHVALVDEDYAAFVERARREGADYVVANERNLKSMRLRNLMDEEGAHEGLRLVHRIEEAAGHRILVYELAEAPDAPASPRGR